MGFAAPQPEDRLRENEHQIVPLVEAQISEGFRLTVIERWLRVYGDSSRRITETEVDWWHTEVELPLLKSGMTPAEMIEAADSRVAQEIAPHLDQTILAMYHGHQEHTWMKSILDGIEATLSEAGVYSRLERPRPSASSTSRDTPDSRRRSVATKPRPSSPAHCRGWCDVPRDPTGASPSSGWATE